MRVLGCTGMYWGVLCSAAGVLACIGVFWGVLSSIGVYWDVLGCAGMCCVLLQVHWGVVGHCCEAALGLAEAGGVGVHWGCSGVFGGVAEVTQRGFGAGLGLSGGHGAVCWGT